MPSSSPTPPLFSQLFFSFLVYLLLFLVLFSSSPISASSDNINASSITRKALSPTHPHQKCIHQHLSALLQLKRGFNFSQSFPDPSSWYPNNTDCCSWQGITCNSFTGHVVGLNLSNLLIERGAIDFESLFHLRSLQILDLSGNGFSWSSIPSGFGQLSSLTHLHLPGCNFYGQIPQDIFQLTRLVSLDLSSNSLELESSGMGQIFQNLSSLRELNLDNVYMSAVGSHWSQILPYSLPSLRKLSMRDCGLSGPIHPSLSRLHLLTHLDLSFNDFSSAVPQVIANFTSLTSLTLSLCDFHGEFPKGIFSLPKLQTIDISQNEFLTINLPKFSINSTIHQLTMRETQFHGNLADFLGNFNSLTHLDLSGCNISGPIPQSHLNLSQLVELDLRNNNIQGPIPTFLLYQPQLRVLHLSSNKFSGFMDLSKFPHMLRNQKEMQYLDLSCNRISGKIPEWIWVVGNGSLNYLNLSNNALEGLEGPFPNLSLTSMSFLDLSANMLKGSVLIPPPSSIFFSLANNALDGEVPSLFCHATSLRVLDLSSNSFTGPIPQCLGEISDVLAVLNLRKNAFRGPLLQTFKEGCTLETMDLSDNQLEGQMPKSLANCQKLTVLDLGKNRIKDAFPSQLGNLSDLRVLVLRSNKFYGSIGRSTTSQPFFSHLQIIDVSFNKLSGSLPSSLFSAWKMMKKAVSTSQFLDAGESTESYYQGSVISVHKGIEIEFVKILFAFAAVDFSHNEFHGDIPSSIGELKSLHLLNLSHNHFQGIIPPSLGNMRELESLDLSQNSLLGEIPWQLTKLSFLAVLNLSQNQLTGSIPQDRQLSTFKNDSFVGNPGLCGPPLSRKCEKDAVSPPSTESELDFMWIGLGIGHAVGFGIIFWTLILWGKAGHAFFAFVDRVFLSFFLFAKRCGV